MGWSQWVNMLPLSLLEIQFCRRNCTPGIKRRKRRERNTEKDNAMMQVLQKCRVIIMLWVITVRLALLCLDVVEQTGCLDVCIFNLQ